MFKRTPVKSALLLLVVIAVGVFAFSGKIMRGQVTTSQVQTKVVPPTPVAAPSMRRPEPGSADANRMAEFVAQCKAGLVPAVRIGVAPNEDSAKGHRMPAFEATTIVPQAKVKGDVLRFQQRLADVFAAHEPMPASRLNHFSWVKQCPNARIYGWYGTITGVSLQADSSVIVTIEFHPKNEIVGQRALMRDYVTEAWLVSGGRLELIDTDAATINPAIQGVFPL